MSRFSDVVERLQAHHGGPGQLGELADEARAVHHVGAALDDRLEQARVLGGVVFQVGVLDEDDVAAKLEAREGTSGIAEKADRKS